MLLNHLNKSLILMLLNLMILLMLSNNYYIYAQQPIYKAGDWLRYQVEINGTTPILMTRVKCSAVLHTTIEEVNESIVTISTDADIKERYDVANFCENIINSLRYSQTSTIDIRKISPLEFGNMLVDPSYTGEYDILREPSPGIVMRGKTEYYKGVLVKAMIRMTVGEDLADMSLSMELIDTSISEVKSRLMFPWIIVTVIIIMIAATIVVVIVVMFKRVKKKLKVVEEITTTPQQSLN